MSVTDTMKVRFVLNNYDRYDTAQTLGDIIDRMEIRSFCTDAPEGNEGRHWPAAWKACPRFLGALKEFENLRQSCSKEPRTL